MLQEKSSNENVGPGGIPKSALTSDFYGCKEMPERFNHPGQYGQLINFTH